MMDSCNSGSLQSSSGDEEYDSRAAVSVPPFMTANPPPIIPPLFDPPLLTNYFLNTPRSDPNSTINNIIPCFQARGENANNISFNHAPPLQNQNQTQARNPKKRSRASRRAPTTVLTTDTTNFRAMVQEFTGVPASPFQRSKLDLYTSAPPYLCRPLPHKFQPPFLGPSSSLLTSSDSCTTNSACGTITMRYQLPITQSSDLFNIPFQSNHKIAFPNSSDIMGSNNLDPNAKITGGFDEFGLSRQDGEENSNTAESVGNNPIRPDTGDRDHQSHPVDGNNGFSGSTMNNFNGEKGPGNNVGMVESWICTNSD